LLLGPLSWIAAENLDQASDNLPALALLRDASGQLDIKEVAGAAYGSSFRATDPQLALGYTHDVIWLRFMVSANPSDAEPLLEVAPAVLDYATLYIDKGDGSFKVQRAGNMLAKSTRTLPYHHIVFSLATGTPGSHICYLRLQSSGSLPLRLRLWNAPGLVQAAASDGEIYGAYIGMAMLVIAYNLIFWFWLREPLHLAYSGYVLVNCVSFSFLGGHADGWLPDTPGLADHAQKAMVLVQLATSAFFFTWLFRFKRYLPIIGRINQFIGSLMLCYAAFVVVGVVRYAGQTVVSVGLLQIVLIECCATYLVLRGRRELTFYLSAFTAFLLSAILMMLHALGLVPFGPVVDYLPLLASAVHMVLINVGMAQRARTAEHARRTADRKTISLSLQNERELEQRVNQRTKALEQANAALQKEVQERKELQAQLHAALSKEREAMASQRQFVGMVSHEFRTPLAIIDATAQRILLQHAEGTSTLTAPMQKIRRGVQRLTDLIDTFLGEERLPTQGQVVVSKPIDLYALALRCMEQHSPLAAGLIHCTAASEPIWVQGDSALLTLVLSNLVDNALKYSPAGSPINLTVGGDAQRGWVEVIDHGQGIAPGDRERIFDKHVRLSGTSGVVGTGLGLHISRNAARRMGGDIELDSELGVGSRFRLWLPRTEADSPRSADYIDSSPTVW
jgi:signal transduction histidine kinase